MHYDMHNKDTKTSISFEFDWVKVLHPTWHKNRSIWRRSSQPISWPVLQY